MLGVTLSADEIEAAPPGVRRWLEQEIARAFGRILAEPARCAAAPLASDEPLSSDDRVEKAPEDAGGRTPIDEKALATHGMMVKMGSSNDSARAKAVRHLIATRAYELWENQGRPHGRDLINWRQAEQEILSCVQNRESTVPDR